MSRSLGSGTRQRQRGVALLMAILLVALGTILAATLGYKTVMTARRGAGVLAFDQSLLAAETGEALAGYALHESALHYPQDNAPNQPWAMPYGPVQIAPGVTLQASLEDLQGRFNLNNLVSAAGQIEPNEVAALRNLLSMTGLASKWANMIADWIAANGSSNALQSVGDNTYLSQTPPYRAAHRQITSTSELLALPGFGTARYEKLAPYIAALPQGTSVNLCTASGPVLDALGPADLRQYSDLSAAALAKQRASGCWPTLKEYKGNLLGNAHAVGTVAEQPNAVSERSSYFLLTSVVDIGNEEFYLYSLLYRQGSGPVRVIQRSFTPS